MTRSASNRTTAILLAAGQSTRMAPPIGEVCGNARGMAAGNAENGETPSTRKPFLVLEGLTVLEHACDAFHRAPNVIEIVIVAHESDVAHVRNMIGACPAMQKVRAVVPGGELRTDSVRAGIQAVGARSDIVAIHDVARPLVEPAAIERAIAAAVEHGAALLAVPATDTVKISSDGAHTESTLDRSVLWCAQTPQVFQLETFKALLDRAAADGFRPTDDAALHEKYRGPVTIVLGDRHNVKLTTPDDLPIAAAIVRSRAARGGRRR